MDSDDEEHQALIQVAMHLSMTDGDVANVPLQQRRDVLEAGREAAVPPVPPPGILHHAVPAPPVAPEGLAAVPASARNVVSAVPTPAIAPSAVAAAAVAAAVSGSGRPKAAGAIESSAPVLHTPQLDHHDQGPAKRAEYNGVIEVRDFFCCDVEYNVAATLAASNLCVVIDVCHTLCDS